MNVYKTMKKEIKELVILTEYIENLNNTMFGSNLESTIGKLTAKERAEALFIFVLRLRKENLLAKYT